MKPSMGLPDVLDVLQEELAEAIVTASKIKRFGMDSNAPGSDTTNWRDLEHELGDVITMIELIIELTPITHGGIAAWRLNKLVKI